MLCYSRNSWDFNVMWLMLIKKDRLHLCTLEVLDFICVVWGNLSNLKAVDRVSIDEVPLGSICLNKKESMAPDLRSVPAQPCLVNITSWLRSLGCETGTGVCPVGESLCCS